MLLVGAGLTAVVFGFYLTRTQNYNFGGNSVALRWMLWLVPLWLVGMIPVFDAWGSRRGFQIVASILLAASVVTANLPGSNPWQSTWLLSLMDRWKWVDYSQPPPPFEFGHPLWSWFPKLGDPKQEAETFVRFTSTGSRLLGAESSQDAAGESDLSLLTGTSRDNRSGDSQAVQVIWNDRSPAAKVRATAFFIDVAKFNSGRKSSEFLQSSSGSSLSRDELLAAQRLVTGLPQSVEYRPGHIRYLKTALRPDKAFRCQRAAAQVLFQPKHAEHALRYRVDLWLCEEIPFGVAQMEITITDPLNSQMLTFQRLTAVEATGFSTHDANESSRTNK